MMFSINWGRRSVAYIFLTIVFWITLEIFNLNLQLDNSNYLLTHVHRLSDAALLALPIAFIRQKWFAVTWVTLCNIYLLVNLWYYRNFFIMIPMNAFNMVGNLDGLGASIFSSIRWKDVLLIIPSIAFLLYYVRCNPKSFTRKDWICTALGMIYVLGIITSPYTIRKKDNGYIKGMFQYEPLRGYSEFGLMNYWINQLSYMKGCSDQDIVFAENILSRQGGINVEPLIQNTNKNLIIITVESLSSWSIGTIVDGCEITPQINSLIKDSHTIYFPRVLTQVKSGRSSDAQLMLNTGLLPLEIGAASEQYAVNAYPSLADALKGKGYSSIAFVCDSRSYWNQAANYNSFGYDTLYDKMGKDELYRQDEHLFADVLPKLKKQRQPFLAQLVTMSMHDAYHTDIKSNLDYCRFVSEDIRCFAILTQYTDSCIGAFINSLKREGLYDNSIIVIMGDHVSFRSKDKFEGRQQQNLTDTFIPLIILNSPIRADGRKVIAQSDIYPTLLDLMGVENYHWRGLGESAFRNHSGCAVYYTGEAIGNTSNKSLIEYKKDCWKVSDIILRSDYFKTHSLK